MATIPASELVQVVPSVLPAGGSALDVIGLMLTTSTRPPIGSVQSFADATSVENYFGSASDEATLAGIYFAGFEGSSKLPASLLMAQYPLDAVGAYLRGADISGLTLVELQALSGALGLTIDSVVKSGTVDLSAATSFSSAAQIIADTLDIEGAQVAEFTGDISGTTLTVTLVTSGTIEVGQLLTGTSVIVGTYIAALASGTGGTGTYTVSPSQTAASQDITANAPGVSYDSTSGALIIASATTGNSSTITFGSGAMATSLSLTEATGAVLSQGTGAATAAAFMNSIIAINSDWATFMTTFDPDEGSGNTLKLAFAAWNDTQNDRFGYVCWDPDTSPTTTLPATSSLGYLLDQNGNSGTCLIWDEDATFAAFVCGAAASINFDETNGRIDFAYKSQSGLTGNVTSADVALNLAGPPMSANRGNGYNFYGAYGAANQGYIWLQRGFVTGNFLWFDSYINQIWFNAQSQLALLSLLGSAKSIPYSTAGYSLIEAALADIINQGLNFGAFGPGSISSQQAALVNGQAGATISPTLQTQGYYLQIKDATAAARSARTSPPATFWYLDRGSVQSINLSSVALI